MRRIEVRYHNEKWRLFEHDAYFGEFPSQGVALAQAELWAQESVEMGGKAHVIVSNSDGTTFSSVKYG